MSARLSPCLLLVALLNAADAFGQAPPQPAPAPPAPAAPAPAAPLIDPARELKGLALVKALRQGGYVLYMRHAAATVGADQSLPSIPKWWENCAVQRNLSDLGRDQAKKVGEALRELAVPIAEVKSSQFCRNLETARLMGFKAITITEDINHPVGQRTGGPDVNAQRYTHLVQIPRPGTNTLLISHTQGSSRRNEMLMGQLQEAEIIVYLPDGAAEAEPLARIPVADWPLLVTLDWADKASRPQPSPSGRAPGKK